MLMVHASPRRPVNEYLFAEDVYTNPNKILSNFEKLEEHLLRQSVERSGRVHTRGAELLKMSYKTYIYRLKKFGIVPP